MPTRPSRPIADPPQFDADERFLAVGEVADYFDVTDVTIKNWVDQGRLLAARTAGGHRRVAVSSVAELLEGQGRPVPPELASKSVVVMLSDDETLARTIRRVTGARTRVLVVAEEFAAVFTIARARVPLLLIDVDFYAGDVKRMIAGVRAGAELEVILFGTVAPARTAQGVSPRNVVHVHRRTDRDELLASVTAILERGRQRSTRGAGASRVRAGSR
ncbi:MAG: hypothetical protein NVSMB47_18850 [Polyangiales bacterium]